MAAGDSSQIVTPDELRRATIPFRRTHHLVGEGPSGGHIALEERNSSQSR